MKTNPLPPGSRRKSLWFSLLSCGFPSLPPTPLLFFSAEHDANAGTARHAATTASPPARSATVAVSLGQRERATDPQPQAVPATAEATAVVAEVTEEAETAATSSVREIGKLIHRDEEAGWERASLVGR